MVDLRDRLNHDHPSRPCYGRSNMRGLHVFITDVRSAQNKEEEEAKVNKEMAKIRKKFKEAKQIDGYARKKYVSKLMYIYMLGYEIDFGYMEAVTLLSATKFSEKLTGYLAMAVLLHENHEMLPLVIQSLQNDLQSRNDFHQSLALCAIANIGSKEMSESLSPIVQKLLIAKATKPTIKKKAALCLLRLYRKFPESVSPDSWSDKILLLLDEPDLGSLTAIMGLLLGMATDSPKAFESSTNKVILLLSKIVLNREYSKDYVYYNIANPWLQVKLLRFLSLYDPPTDSNLKGKLQEVLKRILSSSDTAKGQTINHKNALNCVLFEAIALVVAMDDDRDLIRNAATLLAKFVSPKEHSNIRYLALAALSEVASLDSETRNLVTKHQETVLQALRDVDISIRKRALDLLYGMCDKSTAKTIVSELLNYLASADFAIKEELVLKIAILAEKYAADYSWYVDVIFQLISLAGDFVTDDIWYRVVQIVTNHEDIQEHAAKLVLNALKNPECHEIGVKVGGYILGEFGHLIADNPAYGPRVQFEELHKRFHNISNVGKCILLSTYVKFVNIYPDIAHLIKPIFHTYSTSIDAETQQRAFEYSRITTGSDDLMQTILDAMPQFSERAQGGAERNDLLEDVEPTSRNVSVASPQTSGPSTSNSISQLLDINPNPQPSAFPPNSQPSTVNPFGQMPQQQPSNLSQGNFGGVPQNAGVQAIPAIGQVGSFGNNNREPFSEQTKKNSIISEGVCYQDENIQIGFKSEYSNGLGRMMLYYGNTSGFQLTNFRTTVVSVPFLNVNAQPVGPVIEPRTQLQQLLTMISSLGDFNSFPSLEVAFVVNGRNVQFSVKLPVILSKFVEPLNIQGGDFFVQWKQLESNGPHNVQQVVKSSKPVDISSISKVLNTGLRFTLLTNVDPNLNNIVGTGNYATSTSKSPFLFRIESNPDHQMYRISVRSGNPHVASGVTRLLEAYLS
ncbi:hypothetical protein PROFUN_10878 [Planoprotostelium fungivorum]|uniref:AP-2 complex subunit alpha n=1 Tax=Planoprotostelium fungivorum TaxID=1890364 RepID=A0A2P6NC27_9EUKA|nr:hypothetical protein PROFUN_10878 [Planoprotostelium fungivorum]